MYRVVSVFIGLTIIILLVLPVAGCRQDDSDLNVPYATTGDYLGKWDGKEYQPIFVKGINLGVGIPGTQAGELAATTEQYQGWLNRMGEVGINAIRLYTLHYPRFYRALVEYNESNADNPIYLFQGIWLEENNPSQDLFDLTSLFDSTIKETIDCVYGNRQIAQRFGRAFGSYEVDVSKWVIGWIIGREISPHEALTTNESHSELKSYKGETLQLNDGNPTEIWLAERIDKLVEHERNSYRLERPVSFSNWPTLDPLTHPTELSSSFEDSASIDLANIDMLNSKAGFFISYHAYPYYPDFINEDPNYRQYEDELGPNNYLGYLHDLKTHYKDIPLLIAEFGVPSSWGNAHFSYSGMHHGGHDEIEQGYYNTRMLNNIYNSGCAGGMLFEWIDEWWKRTWIVDELEMPRDRLRLWHNVASPEENFGLVTFDLGEPGYIKMVESEGTKRIREVSSAANAAFFFIRISLNSDLQRGETIIIGLDTYRDDFGESILPDGTKTSNRSEFALIIETPSHAQLYVTQAYDLFGIWHNTSKQAQFYHSIASDGDPWMPVRWKNDREHYSDDGQYYFPETIQEIGKLSISSGSDTVKSTDAIILSSNTISIRIPWTFIQFTDPSTLSVLHDNRNTVERETAITEGIALSVSLGGELVETGRYSWEPWNEAPLTTEREKRSLEIFANGLKSSDYTPRN